MAEKQPGLLLTGGHVIDPANGLDGPADVELVDGRISAIGSGLKTSDARRIDVSGLYVTPGIIDIHTHVYTFVRTAESFVEGMNADAHMFTSGVTTTVDAGTAGWRNFGHFKESCIDRSKVRILAFINIADDGMVCAASEQEVSNFRPGVVAAVAEEYSDIIVGIKSAHYWTSRSWDDDHPPWASVENAVEAGDRSGMPVMVDFWPRPPDRSYPELILEKLRPGDIHTHVFARQFPIIDNDGKAYSYLHEARKRGVVFDLGHGAASFWFRNAIPALEDGFPPDSISTDFHMGNVNGPVVSMIHTMSKYLSMGMSLTDVVARSTVAPAREIGRPSLGTLTPGSCADVAVFCKHTGSYGFTDCGDARLTGHEKLECAMTIRGGEIVYNPTGLGMPVWRDAPAPYWDIPSFG